ncbi:pirin family protein [Rhodovulum visakhapatnamense]|uniref:Pirin N-terminal domain-containing protein n=1 Tax=Rhodovulum visakhapatnamense TaxID=364297 RepID=A0A4R8FHQ5_9RHOB|nr:pirin-like bicupin family protein [Rhodovulum visakhapatnamense]TDX25549.1 hypothetical protein EV657_11946 [Rhodovulum visakhapatnamense]
MPILIHENMSRGRTRTGWLDAFHSFSFGGFHDPARMGFGRLRVLNEDRIVPGAGFPTHDHADIDILTLVLVLVLSGRVRHADSLGNRFEIGPGELQLMRAGRGVTHSDPNPSPDDPVHLLQIWLIPDRTGGTPSYRRIARPEARTEPVLLAAGSHGGAPLDLGADSRVLFARPAAGTGTRLEVAPGRKVFVHLVEGLAAIEDERLVAGDGLQLADTPPPLTWRTDGAILIFDMAP